MQHEEEPTVEQTVEPIVEQTVESTVEQPEEETAEQPTEQPAEQSVEPTVEQPVDTSVVTPPQGYFVIRCPMAEAPQVLFAASTEELIRTVRNIASNDQQYLYVIKGGELARLVKSNNGLIVKFQDDHEKILVRLPKRERSLEDGWLGD